MFQFNNTFTSIYSDSLLQILENMKNGRDNVRDRHRLVWIKFFHYICVMKISIMPTFSEYFIAIPHVSSEEYRVI